MFKLSRFHFTLYITNLSNVIFLIRLNIGHNIHIIHSFSFYFTAGTFDEFCPEGEELSICGKNDCQPTCQFPRGPKNCTEKCRPGCICYKTLVRREKDKKCVPLEECHYNYQPGKPPSQPSKTTVPPRRPEGRRSRPQGPPSRSHGPTSRTQGLPSRSEGPTSREEGLTSRLECRKSGLRCHASRPQGPPSRREGKKSGRRCRINRRPRGPPRSK